MKIVLDTNILISFALNNQEISFILNYLTSSGDEIFADNRLMHEYKIIPKRKKLKLTDESIQNLYNWVDMYIIEIKIDSQLIIFNPDRQDSKLIEIANSANCDYILSQDKPLINRASHLTNAKLVAPEKFIEIIKCL